jgi:hypothetical protein
MGIFKGAYIIELNAYENPKDTKNSNYVTGFPVTVPEAVADTATGGVLADVMIRFLRLTCGTAAATAAKTVAAPGPALTVPMLLAVTYTLGNTADSPTINIGGGGAKAVRLGGTAPTGAAGTGAAYCAANGVLFYLYDGTYMHQLGSADITDTALAAMPATELITGSAATLRAVRADYLKAGILGTLLTGLSTAANAVITATDTVLTAPGKLQAQISALVTAVSGKQAQLNGSGFVRADGTGISYDNTAYTPANTFTTGIDGLQAQITALAKATARRTVTVPASAWTTSGGVTTATFAVVGMTAAMPKHAFLVRGGGGVAQERVEAAAGLGDTDPVQGAGTLTLTCTGTRPATDIVLVVEIYGG